MSAGALELRNYPSALRQLVTPSIEAQGRPGRYLDMGAVDVWRSREAKVALFNAFREVRYNGTSYEPLRSRGEHPWLPF